MKITRTLFPLSVLAMSLMGCSQPEQQTQPQAQPQEVSAEKQQAPETESARLTRYFENMFDADLKRSPMYQSYLGYKWDYDKWNDISEASNDEQKQIQLTRIEDLKGFDKSQLSDQQKLSLDIAIVDLQRRLANDEFRHHTYIMHQFRAIHTVVPSFLSNIHKIDTLKDAEDYISRLNGVETLFAQTIEQL